MLDNVSKHLSVTFLLVSLSCGALLQYLVYLELIVIIIFRLINHKNRVKTFACIHYSSAQVHVSVKKEKNGRLLLIGGGSQDRTPGLLFSPGAHLNFRLEHF
jgi:hypothetical protein